MENLYTFREYRDYPAETRETLQKINAEMERLKEEEKRKFPWKKKGYRKHVR